MSYDWTVDIGVTPPFEVTYECIFPKKKLVLKSDLDQGSDASIADSLTVTCQDNGTYDKLIEDYACTRVCPHPQNPDEELFEISHNITTDPKPEIYDTVTYWCKEEGKKLVSKLAFSTGAPTNQLDDLMSMCQITGWLNETIGSYACTQDCEAPINYTKVFDYDYSIGDPTLIGTEYKYSCIDSRKKVVNLKVASPNLTDDLTIECLYNGQWDIDVTDYGCTECLRRFDPPNGKVKCQSKRYAEGSKCEIICDPGYIPLDQISTTCEFDKKLNDYVWSFEDDRLQCVKAISLIIGGIQSNYEYINDVEVFSAGLACSTSPPNYPHDIVGTVGGFLHGQNIVCGGGKMEYVDCSKHSEGMTDCKKNIDCVQTSGGAQWCTGPKIKHCYSLSYDLIEGVEKWLHVLDLKIERAYASAAVLPTGEFWITGGASKTKILDTIEIAFVVGEEWRIRTGPKLTRPLIGHCIASLNADEVIVAGGYSPLEDGYSKKTEIYNLVTRKWESKNWMNLRHGPRFDAQCLGFLIGDEKKVVISGGWNSTGMAVSEYFEEETQKWNTMGTVLAEDQFEHAMTSSLRSGAMVDLDGITYMTGGVICTR